MNGLIEQWGTFSSNQKGWITTQILFSIEMKDYIVNITPVITIKESSPGNLEYIAHEKTETSFYGEYYSVPSTEAHPRNCDWYIRGY